MHFFLSFMLFKKVISREVLTLHTISLTNLQGGLIVKESPY
jgi:hypothetical protein